MYFLLARDTDGSLRLLSQATFETRRDALDELANVAGDSASFSDPEEVFLGDLDAVSPILLVRVGGSEAPHAAPSVEGFAEASPVEPVYADAVLADLGLETAAVDEPAELVEEALIEAAVSAPATEASASAEEPESSTWPWLSGPAEAPELAQAAEPEAVSAEAEQPVEAYQPAAYEEPAVDAVSFVPPAEDVYAPRPVIMGDYADEHVPGWGEIREPKGVTEAESQPVDPFAAVEAPATEAEDLPGDLGHEPEAVEEPSFDAHEVLLADSSFEEPTISLPDVAPDPGLPMWQPDAPAVLQAEMPVAESPQPDSGIEPLESEAESAPAEFAPTASAPEQTETRAYVEVPEEASAAFPGLQAFFASRGVTPDMGSVPGGMPREEQLAPSAQDQTPENAADVPGYELGGSDLASSTCEDCVYVNTCPKANQSTPAECGSFQWKAV